MSRLDHVDRWLEKNPNAPDRNTDHYGYCENTACPRPCRVYYIFDQDVPPNVNKRKDGTRGQRLMTACSKLCAEAKRKRKNEERKAPHRKAKVKVYQQTSEVDKANKANCREQRKINYATKPGNQMCTRVVALSNRLLDGGIKTSPTFFERTGIRGSDYIAHIVAERLAKGIVGNGVVEHKIPQVHFDFNNPEDVIRCWILANITVLQTKSENSTKMTKFEHTPEILGWPEHHFPTAWAKLYAHNVDHPGIPTEDEARVRLQNFSYGDPVD
jgi:hypothetical protein